LLHLLPMLGLLLMLAAVEELLPRLVMMVFYLVVLGGAMWGPADRRKLLQWRAHCLLRRQKRRCQWLAVG
jgi:hypothetical protein